MLSDIDKYLLKAIRDGDAEAFETLFNAYYPKLCKYAKSLVQENAVAEDIVSEVFVHIWEHQENLNIQQSVNAYLFRSVHNRCLNYLARTRSRYSELDNDAIERLNQLADSGSTNNMESLYHAMELLQEIDIAIEKLPEECQKIFRMSRHEELSHKEIATHLGISENTVKVQIYRALIKLRESLKDFLPLL